jgi:hypothetical protein
MQQNRTVGVAEVAECLPSMHEALNHHQKKKKKKERKEKNNLMNRFFLEFSI